MPLDIPGKFDLVEHRGGASRKFRQRDLRVLPSALTATVSPLLSRSPRHHLAAAAIGPTVALADPWVLAVVATPLE